MIPKIKRFHNETFPEYKWIVIGNDGSDLVKTFPRAIRYWLWHCGVNPKIAFFKW
jgi:hypothetical protein